MKKITLHVYTDPGHGWVRVPVSILRDLEITNLITPYSYHRRDHVYLEEDLDASTLIKKLNERGITHKFVEHHTNRTSKIRGYDSYNAEKVATV